MRLGRALLASVILHGIVFGALQRMPDPAPGPSQDGGLGPLAEVVLLDLPVVVEPKPAPRPPPETSDPPDATRPENLPADSPRPPASAAPKPRASDPATPPNPTPAAPVPEAPTPPGELAGELAPELAPEGSLSLSGLRASTSPRTAVGSLAPRLPAGAVALGPSRAESGAGSGAGPVVYDLPDAADIVTPADAGFVRDKKGRLIFRDPDPAASWTAELLPDGRLRFKDRLTKGVGNVLVPVDQIWAAQGMQFWVQRKKRLLAATQAMRLQMAITFAETNIDRQLVRLNADLVRIWRSERPPRTRRGLLFDVWDDCEESLVMKLDAFADAEHTRQIRELEALRKDAGEQARAKVVAFVRRHLPEGSTDAYSAAELAELNARRLSKGRFDPYAAR